MSFYVYILRCSDGSYYTGHTDGLERRLAAHKLAGFSAYTAARRPVRLQFVQEFPTRVEALERERQIKRWSRRKKQALIRQDWDRLRVFSRPIGPGSH